MALPLGEWGVTVESREGIKPSRAVLQTAILVRESARSEPVSLRRQRSCDAGRITRLIRRVPGRSRFELYGVHEVDGVQ